MSMSGVSRTIAGMYSRPACWDARQRRSPMTSSNLPSPSFLTTTGWSRPTSVMEAARSSSASSSKVRRDGADRDFLEVGARDLAQPTVGRFVGHDGRVGRLLGADDV